MQMARGRQTDAWDHTALLGAILLNIWRGKGKPALKPSQLNPYRSGGGQRGIPITAKNIKILKCLVKR